MNRWGYGSATLPFLVFRRVPAGLSAPFLCTCRFHRANPTIACSSCGLAGPFSHFLFFLKESLDVAVLLVAILDKLGRFVLFFFLLLLFLLLFLWFIIGENNVIV